MTSLWNGVDVKFVLGTGKHGSGKSWFGVSIDPENTFVIDLEESLGVYASYMPIKKRVSMYEEVVKWLVSQGKPVPDGIPTPEQCYLWFYDLVNNIKPGEYSVLMVDPISDIEQGLVDYINNNPEKFGYTAKQFEKSALIWAAVKSHWKMLLGMISNKVTTFYGTTHMGAVFDASGKPIPNKMKAKGKSTLFELASLYLEFKREYNQKGEMPDIPAAVVLKSRLALPVKNSAGFWEAKAMLPPRIPVANYSSILNYISSPPDYNNLKPEETVVQEFMSDDDRLLIQSEIASNTREAELAKLEGMQLNEQILARRAARLHANQSAAQVATQPVSQPEQPVSQPEQPVSQPAKTTTKATATKTTTAKAEKQEPKEPVTQPATQPEPEPQPQAEAQNPVSQELREDMKEVLEKSSFTSIVDEVQGMMDTIWGPTMAANRDQVLSKLGVQKLDELPDDKLAMLRDGLAKKLNATAKK